jgi:hypothetical protein
MNNRFFRKSSLDKVIASTCRWQGVLRHACRSAIEPLEGRLLFSTYTVTKPRRSPGGLFSARCEMTQVRTVIFDGNSGWNPIEGETKPPGRRPFLYAHRARTQGCDISSSPKV